MNRLTLALFIAVALVRSGVAQDLVLADGGRSDYTIVLAEDASPATKYAADELQQWLLQMTGARLPILTTGALPNGLLAREIAIGDSTHPHLSALGIETDTLGVEGYVLRTVGERLVIAGSGVRGALYGVYGLLEDHLGCRWFTPKVSRIPKTPRLVLPALDERVIPRLEYREPFVADCFDGAWCARNRMNSHAASLEPRQGGKVTYEGFVHTFAELVPPAKYYHEHPEYFPLVGGRRLDGYTQLCCTNEDVVRIITAEIRARMRAHPEATVFSVSQNDTGNYCQCEPCQALASAEGAQIAPVLQLVNRVADAVADEFPGKAIDTLAYQWSRKPPKTMRPRPNVIVRLCSIECCFSHPLATCDSAANRAFRDDLVGWGKVCDRLWIWDYTTSFANYFVPFPNRSVLGPNIRFFADHHVTGIFEEDTYSTPAGELNALDGYLQAKLLWDPAYGMEKARDEFLAEVYGSAAAPIRRYLELLENEVATRNIHVQIWEGSHAAYLTDALLAEADRLWDEAEAGVSDAPDVLDRVRIARLSLDWVMIERARKPIAGAYRVEKGRYLADVDPNLRTRVERFFSGVERAGVTMLNESGLSPEAWRARVAPQLHDFEVVTMEGEGLRLEIVPALGGRIVGLRTLPGGANLVGRSAPGEPLHPNAGGYAESWQAAVHGPGWSNSFEAILERSADAQTAALTTKLVDGVRMERRITVPAHGAAFEISSKLVDERPDPPPAVMRAAFCFDLGIPDDVIALVPPMDPGGGISLALQETEARRDIALPVAQVAGGIQLVNRVTGLGILIVPAGAPIERAWLRVDAKRSTVTLEWQVSLDVSQALHQRVQIRRGAASPRAAEPDASPHRALRVVVDDDQIPVGKYGTWGWIEPDATASDGFSIHMPSTHIEWCCQWPCAPADFETDTRYEVFARIRVAKKDTAGPAFWAGIYDTVLTRDLGSIQPAIAEIADEAWHEYHLGTINPAAGQFLWCGPRGNAENVAGVWLDGFELRAVR